jgi:hypothetical protein
MIDMGDARGCACDTSIERSLFWRIYRSSSKSRNFTECCCNLNFNCHLSESFVVLSKGLITLLYACDRCVHIERFGDRVVTLGAEIVRDQATQAARDNEREKPD